MTKFYTAITDVKVTKGTLKNMKPVDIDEQGYYVLPESGDWINAKYRGFNRKFVDTPEKAFKLALVNSVGTWIADYANLHQPEENYDDFDRVPYMNEDELASLLSYNMAEYDKKENVIKLRRFFTTNMSTPKDCHMERFLSNEEGFELIMITFEIQVLETIPATPTLNDICPGFDDLDEDECICKCSCSCKNKSKYKVNNDIDVKISIKGNIK